MRQIQRVEAPPGWTKLLTESPLVSVSPVTKLSVPSSYAHPRRRKNTYWIAVNIAIAARKIQKRLSCQAGVSRKFIPSNPVTNVMGKKRAATTVSLFMTSFMPFETLEQVCVERATHQLSVRLHSLERPEQVVMDVTEVDRYSQRPVSSVPKGAERHPRFGGVPASPGEGNDRACPQVGTVSVLAARDQGNQATLRRHSVRSP